MVTLTDLKEALGDIVGFGEGETGREALGAEQDSQSYWAHGKMVRDGLDAHFMAQNRYSDRYEKILPSSVWTADQPRLGPVDGAFICSASALVTQVASLKAYSYAKVHARTKIPSLPQPGQEIYIGFEGGVGMGVISFKAENVGGVMTLYAVANRDYDITAELPTDYATALHHYSVRVSRPLVTFSIDYSPVAYAVLADSLGTFGIDGPPYTLFSAGRVSPQSLYAFFEVQSVPEFTWPLNPYNTSINEDTPLPPQVFPLYQTGTENLLAGLTVNPNVTSHPVPIFGYDYKTFLFRADEAGDLNIQVLTQAGNWRTYHTEPVAADTLETFIMTGDAVLARVIFTPDAPPANITDAEVIIR